MIVVVVVVVVVIGQRVDAKPEALLLEDHLVVRAGANTHFLRVVVVAAGSRSVRILFVVPGIVLLTISDKGSYELEEIWPPQYINRILVRFFSSKT